VLLSAIFYGVQQSFSNENINRNQNKLGEFVWVPWLPALAAANYFVSQTKSINSCQTTKHNKQIFAEKEESPSRPENWEVVRFNANA